MLDDFDYVSLIGEGYFANVLRYRHKNSGEEIAVKRLKKDFIHNDEYIRWFKGEVDTLHKLKGNRYIIEMINHEISDNVYQYSTPLAECNLYDFIKTNNNKIEEHERIGLFDQIISAIEYAHNHEIIHRDISPNNILVFRINSLIEIRVSDFGLSKNLDNQLSLTRSEVANYGKPYYVAPEQHDKLKSGDKRSDIYSLGKLLGFVMTGHDPYNPSPNNFTVVIDKATLFNPDHRYQTIQDFKAVYEQIKKFLIPNNTVAILPSLKDIAKTDEIEWGLFHKLIAITSDIGDEYYDYVKPITLILNDAEKVRDYYNFARKSINILVDNCINAIHTLNQRTGWPFAERNTFGDFFGRIYRNVDEISIKSKCIKQIWDIAYGYQQWRTQTTFENIVKYTVIPDEVQIELALHIEDGRRKIDYSIFEKLELPEIIRRAIYNVFTRIDEQD